MSKMTEKSETTQDNTTDGRDEVDGDKEMDQIVEEEKEKVEKNPTSHQNGSVRLRKTKRSGGNKNDNAAKKNQEIKKILATKAMSSKSKASGANLVATLKGFFTGNTAGIISFIIIVILTIATRFYTLSTPDHIW